jgi:TRAP-type C4-dicarboxylate transport system permease small subunit
MNKGIIASTGKKLEKVNSILGMLAGYIVFIMNFIVLYAVVMRYIFDRPPTWTTETATFMLMFITFIPLGFVLQNNMHIKVDFVTMRLSDKTQKGLSIFNAFLCAAFTIILFWQSCRLVSTAFRLDWVTMETTTPLGYPLLMMPVGCVILFFSCLFKGLLEIFPQQGEKEEG